MRVNRILSVLSVLVRCANDYPVGMTRGEIRRAAQLPEDTEMTRPLRDLRKDHYGIIILCDEFEERGERVWRYRIAASSMNDARKVLGPSTAPTESGTLGKVPSNPSSDTGVSPSAPVSPEVRP